VATKQVLNYHKARLCAVASVLWMLSVLVLAGCAPGPADRQPELTEAQLVGTWTGSAGSFTFNGDHTFTAADLNLSGLMSRKCRTVTLARGTWEFEGPDGSTGDSLTTYGTGNVLFLNVKQSSDQAQFSCTNMWEPIQLTTWQINGPLGLCAEVDPDSPCAGEPFVWTR
jgi:hypothetical protein